MCGIAGIFEAKPASGEAPLEAMLAQMIPRGPDDAGRVEVQVGAGGRLLLGARRLAILDLSAEGHQPMRDPETRNWLVYNGEIYNFRELREELEARGCRFRSECDTEVLLLGYRVWREAVLERLRGMYAFAIWDEARRTLLLARDRHGIKPLYYWPEPGRLIFASELRALLASRLVPRELDPTGLDSYLKFGAVQEPATLVRGVRLLSAGHLLRVKTDPGWVLRTECYWSLPPGDVSSNGSAAEPRAGRYGAERERQLEEIRHGLSRAVGMRLVSDVPLGVFLSGGLDSSAVAMLAAEPRTGWYGAARGGRLRSFNVTFTDRQLAEGEKARRVANHLGLEHQEITLTEEDLLGLLPDALAAMDQPTVDGINTYFVSRATKQAGVTVALSGLGGDELFAGYRSFRRVPQMERVDGRAPEWARLLAASLLDSRLFAARRDRKLAVWLRREDGFREPFYVSRLVLTPPQVARLLKPEWLLAADYSVYRDTLAERARLLATHDPVNRVSCLELSVYLRNTLLRDTDCMSMANSLEVRVPLLDHVLTERLLRIPGAWKLDGTQRKPLLVAGLPRPLPEEILRQPKRGFELPWEKWIEGRLRKEVEETLREAGPALEGVLAWEQVREIWREFRMGREHWSRPWLFYVLRKWSERNIAA